MTLDIRARSMTLDIRARYVEKAVELTSGGQLVSSGQVAYLVHKALGERLHNLWEHELVCSDALLESQLFWMNNTGMSTLWRKR